MNDICIESINISHHQLPLDPPFPASWDSHPRRHFPATIVRVTDSAGRVGVGSGDAMYGFDDYAHLFIGQHPLALARHAAVLSNIGFHAGRPWPLDIALWDLAGKIHGTPCWRMLGARSDRVRAYASSGTHRSPEAMVQLALAVLQRGFPALKLRLGRPSIEDDFKVISAVREAVGSQLELMVDCNQGWRMPWDIQPAWDLEHATKIARKLEPFDIYWMEEPLHRGDYAGYAQLRQRTGLRIAGGEMTREPYEFDMLLERGCLDIYQPDVACSLGISGASELAHKVAAAQCMFTPHTWGNGIGLMANLHVAAGASNASLIEFPFDPPEWSVAQRDFMLSTPIEPDAEGWIVLSESPGLGISLHEERLQETKANAATWA